MSLSSIIHDRKAIRDGLRARVGMPSIRFDAIKAPPLTANTRIVGAAFDYLLRFLLQRTNKNAQSSRWIAEASVERIGTSVNAYDLDAEVLKRSASRLRRKAEGYLSQAKLEHRVYLDTGNVTDKLLCAALRLAYLDVAYRAGPDRLNWARIDTPDADDLADLRALFALVDETLFRTERVCLLNPKFGAASQLVGGADADLLLDGCLIDIKTVKNPHLDVRDFLQVIGYYFLQGFDGFRCGGPETVTCEVNSIGIYFSRFGFLWKVPVEDVLSSDTVGDTARWFFESVCTSKLRRLKYLESFCGPLAQHLRAEQRNTRRGEKPRPVSKKSRRAAAVKPRVRKTARKARKGRWA